MYSERTKTIRNPFIPCKKRRYKHFLQAKWRKTFQGKKVIIKRIFPTSLTSQVVPKFVFLFRQLFSLSLGRMSHLFLVASRMPAYRIETHQNTSAGQNPTNKNRMEALGIAYHFFGVTGMKWKKSSEKNTWGIHVVHCGNKILWQNIILPCVIMLNNIFKELKFHDSNGSNGETPKKLSHIYLYK